MLAATFDRDDAPLGDGDAIPPGWHQLYLREVVKLSETGRDGHPATGDFLPPVPLPRRMWAASQIRFLAPLRLGEMALKRSEIASITEKSGKSGRLVFVNLRHTVLNAADEVAIEEEQNIVYTEAPKSGAMPPPRPASPSAT